MGQGVQISKLSSRNRGSIWLRAKPYYYFLGFHATNLAFSDNFQQKSGWWTQLPTPSPPSPPHLLHPVLRPPQSISAICLDPFGFLLPNDISIIWLFNRMSVPDDGYSRKAPCALNYVLILKEWSFRYHVFNGQDCSVKRHLQQYFSYFVTVSFIGGGNRSSRRKPPTCRKSLTNFIT